VRSRWVLAYYSTERETGGINPTSWKTKNWGGSHLDKRRMENILKIEVHY
jgi:hypothetical protein